MKVKFIEHLQKLGADARASGASFLSNPFLRSKTLPANSGDSLEVWTRKHDAWHLGWTVEDAMHVG